MAERRGSADADEFVGLQGEVPEGMVQNVGDAGAEVGGVPGGVGAVAGLQAVAADAAVGQRGGVDDIFGVVEVKYDFQFVDALYRRDAPVFGRACHPVDKPFQAVAQRQGAVCLDLHRAPLGVKLPDQCRGELQQGFASGNHHVPGRMAAYLGHNLVVGHLAAAAMVGVAEIACHVASAQPYEHRRGAGVEPLALQ